MMQLRGTFVDHLSSIASRIPHKLSRLRTLENQQLRTLLVARDPYLIPEGQYKGPKEKGELPSWEKAYMYSIMLIAIAVLVPGAYSLDALIFGR